MVKEAKMPADKYDVVIGLEVHAQLLTNTKMWCSCKVGFGDEPNTNVCPVCLGMPGTLPVLNERALEMAVQTALALNCNIHSSSKFARKNYFYPDLPKGYQITQLEAPFATDGFLEIELKGGNKKKVRINRIQLEEDAGKSIHMEGTGYSLVDYNRCGVPLIEIVSEPDMSSAEEAVEYLKSLRQALVYLGVCDGNMEQGSFRCDVNVSLKPKGSSEFGVRAEMKNMNSFKFVQKAIEYEIERQAEILDAGGTVVQETRHFDPISGKTFGLRGKEESHDYRYFPEPDLVEATISEQMISKLKSSMPELPWEKKQRFIEMGLSAYDAGVLTAEESLADFFERALEHYSNAKKVCNWITTELLGRLNEDAKRIEDSPVSPRDIAEVVKLVDSGRLTGRLAKELFATMYETGQSPEEIIEKDSRFRPVDSSAVEAAVDEVIAENPKEVELYKSGKKNLIGFFMGQVMKKTKGAAPPDVARKLIMEKLK